MSDLPTNLTSDLPEQLHETWLVEYKTCQDAVSDHETRIWQSATVFVSISIAGLSLVSQRLGPTLGGLLVISITGLLSIIILLSWYRLISRWWSFQNVLWYRMQELDYKLGMRRNLYVLSLDKTPSWPLDQIANKSDFEKLEGALGRAHVAVKSKTHLRRIITLLVMAWILLLVVQVILFVFKINVA